MTELRRFSAIMRGMKKMFYDTREVESEDSEEFAGPSKSQKKREAEELQALGKELSELSQEQRSKIALPQALSEAIEDLGKMKSFGARRRQLQLIGKFMRALDAKSVREAIDRATGESKAAAIAHRQTEKIRDAMIQSDAAVTDYIAKNPQVPIQKLRQLVRTARKEIMQNKPPKSARELYKLIHAGQLSTLNLLAEDNLSSGEL